MTTKHAIIALVVINGLAVIIFTVRYFRRREKKESSLLAEATANADASEALLEKVLTFAPEIHLRQLLLEKLVGFEETAVFGSLRRYQTELAPVFMKLIREIHVPEGIEILSITFRKAEISSPITYAIHYGMDASNPDKSDGEMIAAWVFELKDRFLLKRS